MTRLDKTRFFRAATRGANRMTRSALKALAVLAAFALARPAPAYEIEWSYTWSSAEITRVTGAEGTFNAPETLSGVPVTSIGKNAFNGNTKLTRVNLPATVTRIGDAAFSGCSALRSMELPAGVTSIGAYAFDYCKSMTSLVLPASVTSIGSQAFRSCEQLKTVYVEPGSGDRLKALLERSGFDTSQVTFTEEAYAAQETPAVEATWFTRRSQALAEALRTGKRIFLICGRDTCMNTMGTKNVSCEEPDVKAELVAKCVLWYSNCDTQEDENERYCPSGSYTLPVVCIIDPEDPDKFIVRTTGFLSGSQILGLLANIPYPAGVTDPMNPGDGHGYAALNARDVTAAYAAPKAVTLRGAAYRDSSLVALVELKLGKTNARAGTSRVSGTVTLLDGKRHTIRAQTVNVDGKSPVSVTLGVRGLNDLNLVIGADKFAGALGRWHAQSANVGGTWTKGTATATVSTFDTSAFPGEVFEQLLPASETAKTVRGKWVFGKAATIRYKDGVLTGANDPAKPNLSGLKLTYTPKKGTFKGSFKVHAVLGGKLKKYTLNVNGVVVDGTGSGQATCRKPSVAWPVTVR